MLQSDRFWPAFCQAIGHSDMETDPRFSSSHQREQNCEALVSMIEGIVASRDCAYWEEALGRHQLVFGRVQSVMDVIQDPQAAANSFFTQVPHPACGQLKLVASPVKFGSTPAQVKTPAPELGQHTEEVLLEVGGYTWEELAQLKELRVIP